MAKETTSFVPVPVAVERPAIAAGPGRPKRENPFTELLAPLVADQSLTHSVTIPAKADSKEVSRCVLDIRQAAKDAGLSACVRAENTGTDAKPAAVLTYWLRAAIKRPRSAEAIASTPNTK